MKALVIYFSRKDENWYKNGLKVLTKGNTEIAAEYIAKAVGGDLFEVEPVKPYAFGYRECCREAEIDLENDARPAIRGFVDSLDGYDSIFVCYPNWCGTVPMVIRTFLDHYDLTGKKLVPLCTNEGSGMGRSERDLKKAYPAASFGKGLAIRGFQCVDSEDKLAKWAKANLS